MNQTKSAKVNKYWLEQKKILQKTPAEFLVSLIKEDETGGVFVTSTSLSDVAREFTVGRISIDKV